MHFFAKKFGSLKKKQYFCTRFREGNDSEGNKRNASLAQSVRASDC